MKRGDEGREEENESRRMRRRQVEKQRRLTCFLTSFSQFSKRPAVDLLSYLNSLGR